MYAIRSYYEFYQDKKLKDAILKGVQHWLDAGYKNKNWYPIQVRAPKHTLHIFLYIRITSYNVCYTKLLRLSTNDKRGKQ